MARHRIPKLKIADCFSTSKRLQLEMRYLLTSVNLSPF
jgi:hypothetical protein